MKHCVVVLIVLLPLASLGCGDGSTSQEGRDLTVTFEQGAGPTVVRCGGFDRRTLALEDGAGTLLVPATGFEGSEVMDNPRATTMFPQLCLYTAVLEDVPASDVYQLVYSSEGEQFRGGYRRADFEAEEWELRGTYDDLIRSRG